MTQPAPFTPEQMPPSVSFKPAVRVYGQKDLIHNAICFATFREAEQYADNLMDRWTMVEAYTVTTSTDPVNYTYTPENGLQPISGDLFPQPEQAK